MSDAPSSDGHTRDRIGNTIRIRGARTHNLRGFDLTLPSSSLVVVTGPSGSGKSSLAFDTIHAESQRRFMSATRAWDPSSAGLEPPEVDAIEGLGVTIGLSQRSVVRNIRSTVATMSGVAEPIRRIFAVAGVPGCPHCGGVGEKHEVRDVVHELVSRPEGTRLTVLATVASGAIGSAEQTLASLVRAGFVRARIDGQVRTLADVTALPTRNSHTLEAVVDRLAVRAADRDRIREAVELAYRTSDGSAIIAFETGEELRFSRHPACTSCGMALEPLEPTAFRRSDARAACPTCAGAGIVGAAPNTSPEKKSRRAPRSSRARSAEGMGVLGDADDEREADALRECSTCEGLGLRAAALDARALGVSYRTLQTVPAFALAALVDRMRGAPSFARDRRIVQPALESLSAVLRFAIDVGLGHVALARRAPSLSNGELSRVRLAGLLANELASVTYVLDEPTAGLHALERPAIVRALRGLVERGNSVIVVEHDRDVIAASDYVVEIGPGAGAEGGALVAAAPVAELPASSLTARLLANELEPWARVLRPAADHVVLADVRVAPFVGAEIRIPRARLTFVTGPSGSGKSTLLGILARVHADVLEGREPRDAVGAVGGFESLGKTIRLDDVSATPGPRSLVATRLGIFGILRELFASLPESRVRGFDAGRFALHAPGGRCEACEGQGRVMLASASGPGVEIECERCGGSRYDDSVLDIRYRGLSIADVLRGTIAESSRRFEAIPKVHKPLASADRLGLGHLTLGRALRDTSGGELVRLRLAAELAGRVDRSLILLDEPTRGLHALDVRRLVDALDELVVGGATLVVADHALEAIAQADFVIDLDVVQGTGTGHAADAASVAVARHAVVAATGTLDELARDPRSPTGRAWVASSGQGSVRTEG